MQRLAWAGLVGDGFLSSDRRWMTVSDCTAPAAPARVTALQADNQHTAHSLTVSWERPAGLYDAYRLQLLDDGGAVLANRSVPAERRSERLEGLTSGRWYRVRVVTVSGGVPSAEATAEGQTREWRALLAGRLGAVWIHVCFLRAGPAAVTNLTLASANASSLSFSWRPSDGHVDAYDVSFYSVPETAGQGGDAADGRRRHQVVLFFLDVSVYILRLPRV